MPSEFTIKALVVKSGYTNSQIATATYTVAGGGGGGVSYSWTMKATPNLEDICLLNEKSASTYYTDVATLQEGISLYIDSGLTTLAATNTFYLNITDEQSIIWFFDRETLALTNTRQQCLP